MKQVKSIYICHNLVGNKINKNSSIIVVVVFFFEFFISRNIDELKTLQQCSEYNDGQIIGVCDRRFATFIEITTGHLNLVDRSIAHIPQSQLIFGYLRMIGMKNCVFFIYHMNKQTNKQITDS